MQRIRALPVLHERWDCQQCGICCRGAQVALNDEDLAQLKEQRWEEHSDFQGVTTVQRTGWLSDDYHLAHRPDGSCVFLDVDGLCQIHKEFGFEAKPWQCRVFPLTVVSSGERRHLTMRRACPTAAKGEGRSLEQHRDLVRLLDKQMGDAPSAAPELCRGVALPWPHLHVVCGALEKIMLQQDANLTIRIVSALALCDKIVEAPLETWAAMSARELDCRLNEWSAAIGRQIQHASSEAKPPEKTVAVVFRQVATAYLDFHKARYKRQSLWRRLRLFANQFALMSNTGQLPDLGCDFPDGDLQSLERPLGELSPELQSVLDRFFVSMTVSQYYRAYGRRHWSLVDAFRGMAISYPVILWLLRWSVGTNPPTADRLIDLVVLADRAQSAPSFAGPRFRHNVTTLVANGDLQRLVCWYGR